MSTTSTRFTRRTLLGATALALAGTLVSGASAQLAATHPTPGSALTADEMLLAELVNSYRTVNQLPTIPISKSLCEVAQWHVIDLEENKPNSGTDSRGQACNMHSWSNKGSWTPVCYTADHKYANEMWNKPREISKNLYTDNGYEIAFFNSGTATPAGALNGWKASAAHNTMLLNQGIWAALSWGALGVGLYKRYAVVWVGELADSQAVQDMRVYLPLVRR